MKNRPHYLSLLFRIGIGCFAVLLAGCKKLQLDPIPFVGETQVEIDEASGRVLATSTFDAVALNDIVQHGHVWGATSAPSLPSPDKTELGSTPDDITFQSQLRRLDGEADYYVRPYFLTAARDTLYGSAVAFRTPFTSFLDLVIVEGGTQTLGRLPGEPGADSANDDEVPAREITLSTFAIGRYEVTQSFWEAVMGNNPSSNQDCPKCPVENVSWEDAQEFIAKLDERLPGRRFRLPSEAQWEFAARGGTVETTRYLYSGSNNLDEVAWFFSNADPDGDEVRESQEVGLKKPNALGIYDMTGNIIEWCNDWWKRDYYEERPAVDPPGPLHSSTNWTIENVPFQPRVCRSSFYGEIEEPGQAFARVSNRNPNYAPTWRREIVGFRLAESIE